MVEHRLAKARVASSNLVFRSTIFKGRGRASAEAPLPIVLSTIRRTLRPVSTSTLTRLAPTQVELEIPITAEELAAAQERAFRRLAKNVKLPGLPRRAKCRAKSSSRPMGPSRSPARRSRMSSPRSMRAPFASTNLLPVDRPKMELLPAEEGKPSRLKATVDVRPAIELSDYKGIEVEREAPAIDDEDVERSIAGARKRARNAGAGRAARAAWATS